MSSYATLNVPFATRNTKMFSFYFIFSICRISVLRHAARTDALLHSVVVAVVWCKKREAVAQNG